MHAPTEPPASGATRRDGRSLPAQPFASHSSISCRAIRFGLSENDWRSQAPKVRFLGTVEVMQLERFSHRWAFVRNARASASYGARERLRPRACKSTFVSVCEQILCLCASESMAQLAGKLLALKLVARNTFEQSQLVVSSRILSSETSKVGSLVSCSSPSWLVCRSHLSAPIRAACRRSCSLELLHRLEMAPPYHITHLAN